MLEPDQYENGYTAAEKKYLKLIEEKDKELDQVIIAYQKQTTKFKQAKELLRRANGGIKVVKNYIKHTADTDFSIITEIEKFLNQ